MEDDTEHTPPTRSEVVTTFIPEPLLPEPDKLIMDHISALMALAAGDEGPTYNQVVKLLSMEYDLPTANLIWETWAPYIAPPEGHPLVGGGLAKDLIVASLCKTWRKRRRGTCR
jgi:hypothetical protein